MVDMDDVEYIRQLVILMEMVLQMKLIQMMIMMVKVMPTKPLADPILKMLRAALPTMMETEVPIVWIRMTTTME